MNKALILVVEDDASVRNLMTTTLKAHEYRCISAANGNSAILEVTSRNPDVIFLDLGLPDIDGVEVIQRIRTWSNVPIIVISARSEDDYLTKPFSVDELLARLRVVERRLAMLRDDQRDASSVFENGDLRIDYASGCAWLKGEELHLTPIEFRLLCLLAQNLGKVLTHTFITQKIWNHSDENELASLRVFMATLRRKIEKNTNGIQYIQTHVGVGYRMVRVDRNRT